METSFPAIHWVVPIQRLWRCGLTGFLSLSLAIGQNSGGNALSAPVTKLLRKPRIGEAWLTMRDGRIQRGRVVRVTDRFVAFATNERPLVCADLELSEIDSVQWLPVKGQGNPVSDALEGGLLAVLITPFFVVSVVANRFERISPPLEPLHDSWVARDSSLEFQGNTVKYRKITRKRGHWSVEADRLHLVVDGEPETVVPFHFDCGALVLDNHAAVFQEFHQPSRAMEPIIGDWNRAGMRLSIRPDGSFSEGDAEIRSGTFTNTTSSVTIQWTDSTGPGGAQWVAPIRHRHIVISIGGVTTEYHYVPPGQDIDL
jgi:hypothetical protein